MEDGVVESFRSSSVIFVDASCREGGKVTGFRTVLLDEFSMVKAVTYMVFKDSCLSPICVEA